MKKLFAMLLTGLMTFSLFACTDHAPQNYSQTPVCLAISTIIQDSNGVDKCFWEDGRVIWPHKNHHPHAIQSAVLSFRTEYDMSFSDGAREIELSNTEFYYPTEFDYDKDKIEIKESNKPNHFIITLLQHCYKEIIAITFNSKNLIADENGELIIVPAPSTITITVDSEV